MPCGRDFSLTGSTFHAARLTLACYTLRNARGVRAVERLRVIIDFLLDCYEQAIAVLKKINEFLKEFLPLFIQIVALALPFGLIIWVFYEAGELIRVGAGVVVASILGVLMSIMLAVALRGHNSTGSRWSPKKVLIVIVANGSLMGIGFAIHALNTTRAEEVAARQEQIERSNQQAEERRNQQKRNQNAQVNSSSGSNTNKPNNANIAAEAGRNHGSIEKESSDSVRSNAIAHGGSPGGSPANDSVSTARQVEPRPQHASAVETHRVIQEVSKNGFTFRLNSCEALGSTLTCKLTVENITSENRKFALNANEFGRFGVYPGDVYTKSSAFDDVESEYTAAHTRVGDKTGNRVQTTLPPKVPLSASVKFENVSAAAMKVTLVRLSCNGASLDEEFPNAWPLDFRNIPITR